MTGRLSAKEPAFQTTPKKTKWAKRLRECFIAPKGKVVVRIDYSQGELKVIACWAPEKTMIQAYLDGLDLHAVTGAKLAVVPLQEFLTWKDDEDKALAARSTSTGQRKACELRIDLRNASKRLHELRLGQLRHQVNLAEAEKMRNAFFELYPGLLGYHERQETFVNLHEMVRSPLGRIRHLPTIRCRDNEIKSLAKRQAINSPIQSCLADMMEWAIALIDAEFPNEEVEVVGNIHDAIVVDVADDLDLLVGELGVDVGAIAHSMSARQDWIGLLIAWRLASDLISLSRGTG